MSKIVAIYARVSSSKQKEEETINSQIEALCLYARQKDYKVLPELIFKDDGFSGQTLQRPALDDLRDIAREKALDIILIHSPDRLSRNYAYQVLLKDEFERYGVELEFLKSPPTDTPEGILTVQFQGIFAEYERAQILERSRRGRLYKAKQGNPSVLSSVAYGYKRLKKDGVTFIEMDPEAASIVKEIFRLYVHEQLSLLGVCRKLESRGIRSPKGGLRWSQSSVKRILDNTAYVGTAHFGKTERSEGVSDRIVRYKTGKVTRPRYARKKRAEDKWHPIQTPQLICENDFEMAQNRLKQNKTFSQRNTKVPSLLQGLLVCGECGNSFYKKIRSSGNKKTGYYCCHSSLNRNLKKCCNLSVKQDELDQIVFEHVLELLKNPKLVEQEIARRLSENPTKEKLDKMEIDAKKELSGLKQAQDRLLDAYQEGTIDLSSLRARSGNLKLKIGELEKKLKNVYSLRAQLGKPHAFEELCNQFLKKLDSCQEKMQFEAKRKVIRAIVEEVIIEKGALTIKHCIASEENSENSLLHCVRQKGGKPP